VEIHVNTNVDIRPDSNVGIYMDFVSALEYIQEDLYHLSPHQDKEVINEEIHLYITIHEEIHLYITIHVDMN